MLENTPGTRFTTRSRSVQGVHTVHSGVDNVQICYRIEWATARRREIRSSKRTIWRWNNKLRRETEPNKYNTYLVKTGNCEPITLKRANNNASVVQTSTSKRFFVSDVQVPDGKLKLFPLTKHRIKWTILRIEIWFRSIVAANATLLVRFFCPVGAPIFVRSMVFVAGESEGVVDGRGADDVGDGGVDGWMCMWYGVYIAWIADSCRADEHIHSEHTATQLNTYSHPIANDKKSSNVHSL